MGRSSVAKRLSRIGIIILLAVFVGGGIYAGVHIGRMIWLWFNHPGQGYVAINRGTGQVMYSGVETATNPIWDVVWGFLGLAGGVRVGVFVSSIVEGPTKEKGKQGLRSR